MESRIRQMLSAVCFRADDEADVAALSTLNNLINLDRIHLNSSMGEVLLRIEKRRHYSIARAGRGAAQCAAGACPLVAALHSAGACYLAAWVRGALAQAPLGSICWLLCAKCHARK